MLISPTHVDGGGGGEREIYEQPGTLRARDCLQVERRRSRSGRVQDTTD